MFVIISQDGKPLTDVRGDVITKATRDEFAGWLQPGERIEPYDPVKHPPGEPRGTGGGVAGGRERNYGALSRNRPDDPLRPATG